MRNLNKIMNKYLQINEEDIVTYGGRIPTRARLMIYPIVKLQTVSGKDGDEIKNKCNKEMVLKLGTAEMKQLFKELEKVKFVEIKESTALITVAITELGKRKDAEHEKYHKEQLMKPPTPVKGSDQDIKNLKAMYNTKPGAGTGD